MSRMRHVPSRPSTFERFVRMEPTMSPQKRGEADPQNWRLNISEGHIELYKELAERLRPLSAEEARMMVELVYAWRGLEHRKHIALRAARKDR